jgi:hypothetical protein
MQEFPRAEPHGPLQELFPDVFFVTGTMSTVFDGVGWQFSRNMTVVRDNGALTLINSVRLDDEHLENLESLGEVKNVVRIGSMHGIDDAFYLDRYKPTYWAVPGMSHPAGLVADRDLAPDAEPPFEGCSVFIFETTTFPEAILIADRAGGIAIASDALQNWTAPNAFFSGETEERMRSAGFFKKANVGPAWMQLAQPAAEDFARLQEHAYRHALCGHGDPLRDSAHEDFDATFHQLFHVG